MNYTPPEKISKTSCKDCIFAIYDGITQTGCETNRIEKFKDDLIEAYDNDKEFFVINRVCTLYRSSDWNDGIKDIEKAKNESYVTFDLLIDCDDIDKEMYEYINNLIPKLSPKVKVKIFYAYNSPIEVKNQVKDLFYNNPSITMSMYIDKKEYIYLNVMQTFNMFHILLNKNNYTNIQDFLEKINESINEDMKKALIFRDGNKTAVLSLVCRILYPNLYLDYDKEYTEAEKQIKENNLYAEF
jgi:hypothetical protein